MRRPPQPPGESIFAHGMWQHMVWVGLLIGAVTLFTQSWALHSETAHWQTMTFTTLTLAQLAQIMAIRAGSESLFSVGIFSNLPLLGAVVLTLLLQLAVIYTPFLQPIFKTEALSATDLMFCFAMAGIIFLAVEVEKWLVRRGYIYRST